MLIHHVACMKRSGIWERYIRATEHCNATNSNDSRQLKEQLKDLNPTIVILDYTSSTLATSKKALQQSFSNKNVEFVMLVDSGLKNNQGGLDFNPYGEIRIIGREREKVKSITEMMQKGLSEEDKLSQKTHEMVRVCKRRGLGFSLYGLFKTEEPRFQIVDEERDLPNKITR